MITCRRATKEDVAQFKSIRLRALQDSPEAFGTTYEGALERDDSSWEEQLYSTVEGDLNNTQLAFDGEDCIGLAAVYREPDAASGHLVMMWVDPEHRGSSAASMMVGSLLTWAENAGFESLELCVTRGNHRASSFYNKMGFRHTGKEVEVDAERDLYGMQQMISFR